MSTSGKKINVRVDDDLYDEITRYAIARGAINQSDIYRELLAEGLLAKTEKVYASLVRQQIKEELDAFMYKIEDRLAYQALDVLDSLDCTLAAKLDTTRHTSEATLTLLSEIAAGTPEETRDAAAIKNEMLDLSYFDDLEQDFTDQEKE